MKKKYIIVGFLILLILILVLVLKQKDVSPTSEGTSNYEFFKTSSYSAYKDNEILNVQLPFVFFKDAAGEYIPFNNAIKFQLINDKNEAIDVEFDKIINGNVEKDFSFYTLKLILPSLNDSDQASYKLLKVFFNNNKEESYDVGNINISKIEEVDDSEDIKVLRSTLLTTTVESYNTILENDSKGNVCINDLTIDLTGYDIKTTVDVYDVDSNKKVASSCLMPNESAAFTFNIKGGETIKFSTIRPVLNYTMDGKQKHIILPAANYAAIISGVEELKRILDMDKAL